MLNKILIPAALIATVIVAGIFAFMPVEKASTVHGTLATTSQLNGLDRGVYFRINQTYTTAAQTASGFIIIPAQSGVTYTGTYLLAAIPNNKTASGMDGAHSAFECGLVDGNGQAVSGTNATGASPAAGTLANLGANEAIRVQVNTAVFATTTAFGGVCEGTIFLQSGNG